MRVSIKLKGAAELERKFRAMPNKIAGRVLKRVAEAGAEEIRKETAARAPVRTSKLAQSIVSVVVEAARDLVEMGIGPGKEAFYGLFVEFGHSGRGGQHVPAHPFLRPAFEASRKRAVKVMQDRFREALLREAR